MSLTDGNYSLGGNIFVVDSLTTKSDLSVDSNGKIVYVDNMNVDGSMINNGSVNGVNNLTVSGDITNTGVMQLIDVLNAGSLDNSGDYSGRDMTLDGALKNSGSIILNGNLAAGSISTSKSLLVNGSLTTGDFEVLKKGESSSVFIGGTLNAGNIVNQGAFSVAGKTTAVSLTNQNGTMTFDDLSLTGKLSNSGTIVSTGFLKANSIDTSGSIIFKTGIESEGDISINASESEDGTPFIGTNGSIQAKTINLNAGKLYAGVGVETNKLNITDGEFFSNGALTAGNVVNKGTVAVKGAVEADSINTSNSWTSLGAVSVAGKLNTAGEFIVMGDLSVGDSFTNGGQASITGTIQAKSLTNAENAVLESLDSVKIKGNFENAGTFTTLGDLEAADLKNLSSGVLNLAGNAKLASLQNENQINFAGQTTVAGNMTNAGNMSGTSANSSVLIKGNLENRADSTLEKVRFVEVNGTVNNQGKITGRGFSSTFTSFGEVVNNGEISNFESVQTESLKNSGKLETSNFLSNSTAVNSGTMLGTGEGAVFKFNENLENSGTVAGTEKITVQENLKNSGIVAGTGKDSKLSANAVNNAENAEISNFESLESAGKTVNEGTITATGAGSNYSFGSLQNSGSLLNVEKIAVEEEADVSGKILGVGKSSSFRAGSLVGDGTDGAFNGTVANFGEFTNNSDLTNEGTILGSGDTAVFNQNGKLVNASSISGFQFGNVSGNVVNSGTMLGTGEGAVFKFNENLENSGTVAGTEKITVQENLKNSGIVAGTGKDSKLSANAVNNAENAEISNFESLESAGKTVNEGTITATGAGSNYSFGSLQNSGSLLNVEKIAVEEEADVSGKILGVGKSSSFRAGSLVGDGTDGAFNGTVANFGEFTNNSDLTNEGTILGSGDTAVFNQNGKLVNASSISGFQFGNVSGDVVNQGTEEKQALISGLGDHSRLTVTGNVSNLENAQIKDFEQINVVGNLTNAGTLENFRNITVDGVFVNSESGALNLTLQDGNLSKITVRGGEAVVNGGSVTLNGEPLEIGEKYSFIIVENIENGGLTVNQELTIDASENSSAIPKLFHVAGFHNQNEYWVTLCRDVVYGKFDVESPNQHNVGTYLDQLAYSLDTKTPFYEDNDLVKVLSALDDLAASEGTSAGSNPVGNALDQLGAGIYANQGILAMQNTWFAHQNLANFIRPLDTVFNEYDHPELRGNNLWGGAVGNSGKIDADSNFKGFSFDSAGVIVGYDFFRSSSFRAGAYFQFMNTSVSQKGLAASSDADQYDLGLYGVYQNDYGYLIASGNLSYGNYSVDRRVAFGGENEWIDRSHHGKRDSFQQSLRVETAANIVFVGGRLVLRPFVGLTYIHMTMDDVLESGGDQYVTAIQSKGFDLNSLRPEIGARLGCAFRTDWAAVGLNFRASWVHEFCDTQTVVENKFSNPNYGAQACGYAPAFTDTAASFLITGTDLGRDYAWLGFGLTADTRKNWTFFGGYDAFANGRAVIHTGNVGVSFNW